MYFRSLIVFTLTVTVLGAQFVAPGGMVESEPEAVSTVQDAVRSIRAEVIDASENTVRISWIPPGVNEKYILARTSNGPISTMSQMLNAEPSWEIDPGRTSKIDSGLSPGSYYYAIVSKEQLNKNRARFYASENYTVQALVISSRATSAAPVGAPGQVSLIYAQLLSDGQVRISWKGIENPGVSYNIYRGSEPLKDTGT